MKRVRASWVIAIGVIAAMTVVPPLREQVRGANTSRAVYRELVATFLVRPGEEAISPYRRQALRFVDRAYPRDPDFLTAAGSLSPKVELGASRVWQASRLRRDPVILATYVSLLMRLDQNFERVGRRVPSPSDAWLLAHVRSQLRAWGRPDRLPPEAAATVQGVLRQWQEADPDNGMPLALQAFYQYGLHRDQEALDLWERASRLPRMCDYRWQLAARQEKLLRRMGMTEADATYCSRRVIRAWPQGTLTDMAHYAHFEGLLAQQQGRAEEALRWWNSTLALGRHYQESSDTMDQFSLGVALEEIGADPIWQDAWAGPRLWRGRRAPLYYGPAHAFYVNRTGSAATAAVRQRLLEGEVREALLHDQARAHADVRPLVRAAAHQELARVVLELAGWCLALLILVSLVAAQPADRAASPGIVWRALTLLPSVAILLAATWWAMRLSPAGIGERVLAGMVSRVGFLAAVTVAVGVPLLAACGCRREGGLACAWRGNLRRALPALIALCALTYLSLHVLALRLHGDWLGATKQRGGSELAVLRADLGAEWDHPSLPEKAWREEAPPEAERRFGFGRSGGVRGRF